MSWERKITSWGNSLALRLPSQLFRKTGLKEGDNVEFTVVDDTTIEIRRCTDTESDIGAE